MPIATPEVYAQMIDRAKEHGFAYPAINVTSSQTLNAALRGFAEAGSDGIVQVSTGGARRGAAVPVAHVGRLRSTARREPGDRPGSAQEVRRRARGDGDGDWGRRR